MGYSFRFAKILCFAFSVILLLSILGACVGKADERQQEISPDDKSIYDLATERYDATQLSEIADFNGSLSELCEKYPAECLRKADGEFRVSYLGEESVAVVRFDAVGKKLYGHVYGTKLLKSDFDKLKPGSTLDDVRIIDPDGEYLFLYTGRNDIPRLSSHYTKDGWLITVMYDDSNTVTSIEAELI